MKVDIYVEKGHGRLFQALISSFYGKDGLNSYGIIDLLKILELGNTYANDQFRKSVNNLIDTRELEFSNCTETINFLCSSKLDISEDCIVKDFKSKCIKYLAKFFYPLEVRQSLLQNYLSLEFFPLISVFQSNEMMFSTEQTLVTFAIAWLEYDVLRQNGSIIERIFKSFRVNKMSASYFLATFSIDHKLLSIWSGYSKWLYENGLSFGLSPTECTRINPINQKQMERNEKCPDKNYETWMVYMTPEEENKRFVPTQHLCVADGIKFSPISITIGPKSNDRYKFSLSLQVFNLFGEDFYYYNVGILPADRVYQLNDTNYLSKLLQYTTWFDCLLYESMIKVDSFTATEDFMKIINENGLYCVFLRPIHGKCPFTKNSFSLDTFCNSCGRVHQSSQKNEILLSPVNFDG